MGKRSNFERVERDFYPTPLKAVLPLLPHLEGVWFIEPCAGDGRLIDHIHANTDIMCYQSYDVRPMSSGVEEQDALTYFPAMIPDYFITNPPWARHILHPLIEHLSGMAPTWLLFDADWMHTKQSIPYLPRLRRVVSVGRVKWIEDSPSVGKDNCCWYLFGKPSDVGTVFYGRV